MATDNNTSKRKLEATEANKNEKVIPHNSYDFDKVIDRHGTCSVKFDFMAENGKPDDTLPLWVADMDFRVAEPVIDAIRGVVDHGIFGYSDAKESYYEAVAGWFTRRFGWRPEKEWLVRTPGVVFAFNIAVQAFTNPGDAVIIQPPVYYPFFEAIKGNGRKLVENPLVLKTGNSKASSATGSGCGSVDASSATGSGCERYEMDLADFEQKIVDNDVKLYILCSPHNPIGRVWTKKELQDVSAICKKHDVLIVADEIHCDFTWQDNIHTMFLAACPDCMDIAMSCTAPSKTFNLAGLQASNIWIPNEVLRRKFEKTLSSTGFFALNTMGIIACETAYSQGEEWFEQCKAYIYANYEYLKAFINERLPMLRVMELQGTYLAWVDFSSLGMSPDEVDDLICNKAKLWLDAGKIFGSGGENYQRFVLACPRATLDEALLRLEKAIKETV